MKDWGQLEPIAGRWIWPFHQMEEGDCFTVAHSDRDPEKLRNMAYVRGAQLGKRFSVERNFQPCLSRVTCTRGALRIEDVMC
jgi:hypothetical protein